MAYSERERELTFAKNCQASPAAYVASDCPEANREQQLSNAKHVWKCARHISVDCKWPFSKQQRSTEYRKTSESS